MRTLAIFVSCLAVARHARRGHREREHVIHRRSQANSVRAAPASQSLAETDQQARFNPLNPFGRVLYRHQAAHFATASQMALHVPAGNAAQAKGGDHPPVMSMNPSASDEGEAQKPPLNTFSTYRFVDKDDPSFEPYVFNKATGFACKTPEHFSGQRLLGASEGSFRIQFTLPDKDDEPKTVELRRSTNNNPSFGAVKVKLPLDMEVKVGRFDPRKLVEVPLPFGISIVVNTYDREKFRLVVQQLADEGNARRAKIQEGDIIRALSIPDNPEGIPPWIESENGMLMLDLLYEQSAAAFNYATLKNEADSVASNASRAEVVFLIERPTQVRGDDDDWRSDFQGGSRQRVGPGLLDRLKGLAGSRGKPRVGDPLPQPG